MVNHLVNSDTLLDKDTLSIFKLLGKPIFQNSIQLKYLIREKYKYNIDPEYIKYLIIDLDANGKAKNYYVMD